MTDPRIIAAAVRLDVNQERARQDEKWGDQSGHPDRLWSCILGEEVGEVCRACLKNSDAGDLYEELIQVAAVAQAWAEAIQKRGVNP